MRILHILDHSLPLQSGYVYRTLGIAKQQRAFGWEPFLLTSGKHTAPGPKRERIGEWEFLRTPRPAGPMARLPAIGELTIIRNLRTRLEEVIREIKPDILHAHSPVLNGIPAIRAGHRYNLPVVYEVRAFWEDARVSFEASPPRDLRYHVTRHLETYVMRRADAVVVICDGLFRDVAARGIPTEKITVVPNAVDRAAFTGRGEPDPELAAKLGLSGRMVLGFFGSFYFYEGLHVLLRAIPELMRHRPNISVLLVGGGPEESRLRNIAEELNLRNVVFAGRVPHEEISRYYDLADLLIFPRLPMRLTELVTPLKPLEAMAQERIVVASNVGGHRELIRDRETGYLFRLEEPQDLAKGILTALADSSSWSRIRAQALEYVETQRSWARSASRYAGVYEMLISSRRESGRP